MSLRNSNVGKFFDFGGNGHGRVTHEASAGFGSWSAVVQILEFTDNAHMGDIELRIGYCDETGKLIARPLYLDEDELTQLGRAISREPEIRRMFRAFCEQIR